jgi:hypothetical protein
MILGLGKECFLADFGSLLRRDSGFPSFSQRTTYIGSHEQG